ncbi:MAG: hypothetical protein H6861_00340 [Rhodospirillales bacterium]|nr:hypothetical protein [Rhodospirillales bacterium]
MTKAPRVTESDKRPRQSLRLEPDVWRAIDGARKNRAGNVSRNTWITEAILEKIARDESKTGNMTRKDSRDV